jgi:hypothetical protein
MNNKTQHDNINAELTKAFFKTGPQVKESPKKAQEPAKPPHKKRSKIVLVLILLVIAGAIAAGVYFYDKSDYNYKVNVNVVPKIARKSTPLPPSISSFGNSKALYDFEKDEEGWGIPAWAIEKPDHVAGLFKRIEGFASNGNASLKVDVDFPGTIWTGALIEIAQYIDLRPYDFISVDIFVPSSCPSGLRGKMIFTTGDDWKWTEMSRSFRLVPGEWTTVSADLSEGSIDWRRTIVDDYFKGDVRKIGVRVESDKLPIYKGPLYIDNLRVYSK